MASFDNASDSDPPLSTVTETNGNEGEKAYWDMDDQRFQQKLCQPPATAGRSRTTSTEEGFLSKLSASEIGSVCDNLAKNVGVQAKQLTGQAKLLGDQAKGYTLANTSSAAAAMSRFKKQIVAAVDGIPVRPDDDSRRKSGTTTAAELHEAVGGQGLIESEGGAKESYSNGTAAEVKEGGVDGGMGEEGKQRKEPEKEHAGWHMSVATKKNERRDQLNAGMTDESGPVLTVGAVASALKKISVAGSAAVKNVGRGGPEDSASGGAKASRSSSTCDGRGGERLEANGDAANRDAAKGDEAQGDASSLKILPRTGSLVGGKQWAVLSAVYETTASIVDETVGDMLT